VDNRPPRRRSLRPCLVRQALSLHLLESGPRWKAPWALPIALLFAGERGKRSYRKVLRKRDRRRRASRKRASPGGLVTGARFVHLTGRLLQPSPSRARDRRCSSHAVGVEAPGVSNHRGSARRRKPNRAPEPRKLGWSGPERGLAAQEGGSRGQPREALNGAREIPVVLVDRTDCKRRRSAPCCHAKAGREGTASVEGALVR